MSAAVETNGSSVDSEDNTVHRGDLVWAKISRHVCYPALVSHPFHVYTIAW